MLRISLKYIFREVVIEHLVVPQIEIFRQVLLEEAVNLVQTELTMCNDGPKARQI